jgi:hypothetical protein
MIVARKTRVRVTEDGRMEAAAPPELAPGEHEAVIVFEEQDGKPPLIATDFPVDNGPWDNSRSLRREEVYGDDGR